MLEEIQKLGGDSVDYIKYHFHFDHAEGNRAFGALGAKIIAHDNSIDYFLLVLDRPLTLVAHIRHL